MTDQPEIIGTIKEEIVAELVEVVARIMNRDVNGMMSLLVSAMLYIVDRRDGLTVESVITAIRQIDQIGKFRVQ